MSKAGNKIIVNALPQLVIELKKTQIENGCLYYAIIVFV